MSETSDVTPAGILAFWREAGRERWYKRHDAFDADIRRRYLDLWEQAATGRLAPWEANDDGALALVIVLDQFPRNMFRGTQAAFSSDALALDIARRAIERGAGGRVDPALLEFLYMPLMHSEHLGDQEHCVALFRGTDNRESQKSAAEHTEIIRRFGRFPHRNGVLGRETTADEQAFLDGGGFAG
jgi:uncharacterized protein (DUF924 family)